MLLNILKSIVLAATLFASVAYAQPPEYCVRVFVNEENDQDYFRPESIGSGSLISPTLIVTNNHVVKGRLDDESIQILFPDWTLAENAKVIAVDEQFDLALIEIDRTDKKFVYLAQSDPLIGQTVIMHGYGYGVYGTGPGKITGTSHPSQGSLNSAEMDDWMFTKGTKSRFGDSGGAVVSETGEMVGTLWGRSDVGLYFTVQSQIRNLVQSASKSLPIRYTQPLGN